MSSKNKEVAQGPVCKSGAKILYAWAMDAPDLTLPQGAGFSDFMHLILKGLR